MKASAMLVLGATLLVSSPLVVAGEDVLKNQCAACHALEKSADATTARLWSRKGPDLQHAGSKFNQVWLVEWLQNPTRIRPAGEFYFRYVRATDAEDVVDEAKLTPHPRLDKAQAESVAAALMQRTAPSGLIEKGAFKNEKVNPTMGAMFFNKLRGCGACHMAKPGTGGQSAPELFTAGKRLQPDYMLAYIKDPQKFDPGVWMPTLGLADADLQRLTAYIVHLSAQEGK